MLAPGLSGWGQARAVLRELEPYVGQRTVIPASTSLPAAERRRAVRVVNLALAAAHEATVGVALDPKTLPTVFASSGGDSSNCHELLQTLATAERQVSPTRFHNSVHNVAAGYWSIATADTAPYTLVSAYDGSFAAGLIEAMSVVASSGSKVMLVAYDLDYPSPLREKRPIKDAFAVALLLRPATGAGGLGSICCSFSDESAQPMRRSELETLRLAAPAARALPMLELVACERDGAAVLEYLPGLGLAVTVSPCA